jgi:hypothetical protein
LSLRRLRESMQCNVEFVHQLSISSRTEENQENFDGVGRTQDLLDAN